MPIHSGSSQQSALNFRVFGLDGSRDPFSPDFGGPAHLSLEETSPDGTQALGTLHLGKTPRPIVVSVKDHQWHALAGDPKAPYWDARGLVCIGADGGPLTPCVLAP